MMNIEQITSRLAKLPDQALQQYAAMHKEDPYIMALAVSESNRRKQMRNAAQAPQGGEQPRVVDQAIQEMTPDFDREMPPMPQPAMLPEDQGIAMLPAGDMNFADGGIVAFADGGDVERYQFGGQTMPAPPSAGTPFGIPGLAAPTTPRFTAPAAPGEAAIQAAIAAAEQASMRLSGRPLSEQQKQNIRARFAEDYSSAAKKFVPSTPAVPAKPAAAPALAPATKSEPVPAPAQGVAAIAEQKKAPPPQVRRTAPAAPAAPAALAAPAPAPSQGIADIFNAQLKTSTSEPNPFAAEEKELAGEISQAAQERLTRAKERAAEAPNVYQAREDRLNARANELVKSKDTNTAMAFLEAGLAIMSTPGSLGAAIGKGARVGTEKYSAGLDKLRSAQERLEEARERIEDLKINRSDMTAKEVREAEDAYSNAVLQGKKDVLGAARTWYGNQRVLGTEVAKLTVGAQEAGKERALKEWQTRFEQTEATKRSNASAGALSGQERMAYTLGGGDLRKGLQVMAEIAGEGKGESGIIMQYAKDPMALKLLEQTDPAMAALVKQRIKAMLPPAVQTAPTGAVRP